jgi:acetyl-CoA C-acetyltransferase
MQDPIVIVGAARTPMGGFMGDLARLTAPELGAFAIGAAVERAGIRPEETQEVIMGNVLSAGVGQAPARQASLGAGLPRSAGCTTLNKVCGSGMKAAMLAHDLLRAGTNDVMVAGGMESMTNAPYLMAKARGGFRLGHGEVKDHMFLDGLEDAYDKGRLMGSFAEECAARYRFTRESQDRFAITSLTRARTAIREGSFAREIVPVAIRSPDGERIVANDEQPLKANLEKIPSQKPAFSKEGTVTAANSSSISDGAAAMVLMRLADAEKRSLRPVARIVGHATYAQEPALFATAPAFAIRRLWSQTGWSDGDVDLYEINEAFAVVAMVVMQDLGLSHDKVNVHGGACALGHPIGASGARIMVTLLAALEKYGLRRGIASLCIGGGEATAIALERF